MELEQRLRRLEDRVAIEEVVVSYFLAADGDDLDGVGASFTAKATFSSSGVVNASSRGDIVSFIATSRAHMGLTIHTPHYVQIAFEGEDEASGVVGAHLELVLGGRTVCGAVRYVDRYVRSNGRWLIVTRDMRTIYMAPWKDVGEAFASASPVRWPGAQAGPSDYPRRLV